MPHDLRFALRGLARSPVFTLIALLTLALGIGANSAIFSVVNAVLLQPLPFHQPDELVRVYQVWEGSREPLSPANFTDARSQTATLEELAYYDEGTITLTNRGDPARLETVRVSDGFFEVMHAAPALGRTFTAEENQPGNHRVTVLSHLLWLQRFGADPRAVGSTITLNGEPFEIVGVMPEGFAYPEATELWIPQEYDEGLVGGGNRGAWFVSAIGRLRTGVTVEEAAREFEMIGRRLEQAYPQVNTRVGMTAVSLREVTVGDIRQPLLILLGAVGLVLLIACANVANLLLARATVRETEMALRSAIGAGRWRLMRQLLTESLLLGVLGGLAGLLLASWGTQLLVSLAPEGIPRLDGVGIDVPVVAFTAAISVFTGLLFGLVPAVQLARSSLSSSLREGGRGGLSGRGARRARSGLVVAEMALAMMLLVGAGLLIRSFVHLQAVDPGFRSGGALTLRLSLAGSEYGDDERRAAFYAELLDRLEGLPGVTGAGAVQHLPMSGGAFAFTFDVEGRAPARPGEEPSASIRTATPDYFRTIGIPLVRGRGILPEDRAGAPGVFLISEEAARRFFPGEDPIGRRLTLGWGPDLPSGTIVGIVGDVRNYGLTQELDPTIYLPHAQRAVSTMDLVLRTAVPPLTLSRAVQETVHAMDAQLPIYELRTLDRLVSGSIADSRFYTLLLSVFSGVALTLAAIGIFGVISYSVSQRTREIGIRMALGADPRSVLKLVVRGALLVAASGVALGLAGAFAGSKLLTDLLYGVTPADPATFLAVAALLMGIALLASFLPARAATRVEPNVALKGE